MFVEKYIYQDTGCIITLDEQKQRQLTFNRYLITVNVHEIMTRNKLLIIENILGS